MSGQDLIMEIQSKSKMLDAALGQLRKRGGEYAKAEHDYRVALSQKILVERDKGTPVSIISDVCRGSAEIAKLKLDRDIAETMYDAAKEACNVYKVQMRILDEQISCEWGNSKQ
jgi:hypothetical protein